jgi:iron complex transport system ATP-binding protein
MANKLIEITRFSFRLGGKDILKDISLTVEEGEYISIVGQNGAGKTTLLKCINKIHKRGSGDIRVAGKRLDKYGQRELARQVSYVPQANGLMIPFTVYEFIMMGRYPYLRPFSSPGEKDESAIHDAMAVTGTLSFRDRLLGTLSGGERQKVFIAAALAQQSKILLLDEPTTFLDPKHESDIYTLLARVNRQRGVTIVSVTHDINSAVLTSRRVLALKNGSVAFYGHPEEFMNNDILQNVFEKAFTFIQHPQQGKTIVAPESPS